MKYAARLLTSLLCCCLLNVPLSVHAKTEEEYQQEIRTLQKRNTQLENKLEQLTADLKNSTTQITLLQDQITQMTNAGEENAEEVKAARSALKDVKKQLKELLADQAEGQAEQQEKLEAQLNDVLREKQKLEKQLQKQQQENHDLEQALDALKKKASADKSAELKNDMDELQAELEKQKKQYKANLILLNEREQELQEAHKKIRSLTTQTFPSKELQQTEARAAELEATLGTLNARLLTLSKENKQLKSQLSSKTPELEQQDTRLQDLEKKLAGAKVTILELDKQRAELESRLEASQSQEQDADQQQRARLLELETALAEANAKVLELNRQNVGLETRLNAGQTAQLDAGKQKDAEILRLEDELLKAADYINTGNAQLAELKQKNIDLNAQLRESQQSVVDLQTQIAQSSDTALNQGREVSRLQKQVTLLQAQLQDSDQEKTLLQDKVKDIEQRLAIQSSVPQEAKDRIQELTQELQHTRTQLQQRQHLEREYPVLQQQVESLQLQVVELEKARETAILSEARAEELQIAFDETHRESGLLQEQALALQKELDEKAETYQTQSRKYHEISRRNEELEQQYQQGLQELALKEKLLQQALLEKTVLEKTLDDEGSQQATQMLQQQIAELQGQLQAYKASELRDAEYSRLVTDLQEKLQKTEAQNALLQKEVLEGRQHSQQAPDTPPAPSEDSGRLAALEQQIAQLETELKDSRQYVQRLQQQLANGADMEPSASPFVAAANPLTRFFPDGFVSSGGTVHVLGSSPDNSKLAYLESNEQQQRFFIFHTLSGQATQIAAWPYKPVQNTRFAWAFDSEHFLIATGEPGNYALSLGDSNTLLGQPIQLPEAHIAFAWSPNQAQFAYFSGSSLIIQNLKQQRLPIQIGHQAGQQDTSLAWSPNGRRIAICASQGASFDISLLSFANNAPTIQPLVASSSDDLLPSWSPDGRYLAFYVRTDQYDTKVAVSPSDKSRAPYIVGHNASLPPDHGPRWVSNTELAYVGEEHLSASHNSVYVVNISTGQRSSVPLSMLLSR